MRRDRWAGCRAGTALGLQFLQAKIHVRLEFLQLLFAATQLELHLLELAVQIADLIFESVHAQQQFSRFGGGLLAPK